MVLDQLKSQIRKWRGSTQRDQSRIIPEEISLKGTSATLSLKGTSASLSADEGNGLLHVLFRRFLL